MFTTTSILALLIGLMAGGGAAWVVVINSGIGAGKKAEKIISDAKKEAEKHKRDSIVELKEEKFKLKQEVDKEIREKKSEIQAS